MRTAILIALIALAVISSVGFADDEKKQTNVYDDLEWMNTPAHTGEENMTAIIKRHMANLLYPVDMTSFSGPDKDAKFRSRTLRRRDPSIC